MIVTEVVRDFIRTGKFLWQLNHSFITLIPKVEGAASMNEYKHIACCNFIYKVIAHLLYQHMRGILPGLLYHPTNLRSSSVETYLRTVSLLTN